VDANLLPIISAIVVGSFTLAGVLLTQRHSDKLDERKRKEEIRRSLREERKRLYIRFTTFMTKFDFIARMEGQGLDPTEFINEYTRYLSEIKLLNPEMADHISQILANMSKVKDPAATPAVVNTAVAQYYANIVPLMQAELAQMPVEQPKKPRWRFW
jgi:transcription initiation factor TFIIIB Brf1 subunit/transcription initiation factor TFIIB